jgi:hypothetical protein
MIAEIQGQGVAGRVKKLEDRVVRLEDMILGTDRPAETPAKAKKAPAKPKKAKKPVETPSAPTPEPETPKKVAPDKPPARGRDNQNRSIKSPADNNQPMPDWLTGNPADVPGEDE